MDTIVASNYSVIFQKKGFIELDKIIQENNYSSVFLFVDSNTNKNCTSIFEKLLIKDLIQDVSFNKNNLDYYKVRQYNI